MSIEVSKETFIETELKKYNITDAAIAKLSKENLSLAVNGVDDKEGYKIVKNARIGIKTKRVEIEKKRKDLKADSLKFGKAVDSEAKRITSLLMPIEEHLISQERIVDDEEERVKAEKIEKEKDRIRGRIERLITIGAVFNGSVYVFETLSTNLEELKVLTNEEFDGFIDKLAGVVQSRKDKNAELKAEQERKDAERKAESKRLEKVRIEQEKKEAEIREQQEKVRIEQEKVEAEKRKIGEDKKKEQEEKARLVENERILKEAKEKARIAAEKKAEREAEEKCLGEKQKQKDEDLRIAMLPDKGKMSKLAEDIEGLLMPSLQHPSSHETLTNAKECLKEACKLLRKENKNDN